MVDYKYEALFNEDSIKKEITITWDGGSIGNTDLHSESITLTETLCSDNELRFGACEASELKFRVSNIFQNLKGKKISYSSAFASHADAPFKYGDYIVTSDVKSADRSYRDITAYDKMYEIIKANVSDWYNSLTFPLSLLNFRNSFCQYVGVEQEEISLANDTMMVEETIKPSELSGKVVIEAICEINGCFGHIGKDGKLHYVHLKAIQKGLYPSKTLYPQESLFPQKASEISKLSKSVYISCRYEEYISNMISKLQIRQSANDIGAISGIGDNCYVVEDNFLVYGKSTEDLQTISDNLFEVIKGIWYRPAQIEAKCNPCMEVGDAISATTLYDVVYTYILQRVMTGIYNFRDSITADGKEYRTKQVNGTEKDIIQLRGKTNELERNVEETRSEIKDVESGLDTKITQTAGKIELEANRATEAEGTLSSRITQNAESITSEVARATSAESGLISRITQTADSITAEVTRAQGVETDLAAAISVQADQITAKVSKGDVSSQLSIESGQVTISGDRFVLSATNCSISKDGKITAKDVDLSGKITATSGSIGGFFIGAKSIATGQSSSLMNPYGVYVGTDGISCGNTSYVFKVERTGEMILNSSLGSITLGEITTGRMHLDHDGISFGTSNYTTKVSDEKIQIHNVYLTKDTIHCGGADYYTNINRNEIIIEADSVTNRATITNAGIALASAQNFSIHNANCGITINGGTIAINADTKISIGGRYTSGAASQVLAFFGATGSSKITVATATASTATTQLNALINALKSYGLIG